MSKLEKRKRMIVSFETRPIVLKRPNSGESKKTFVTSLLGTIVPSKIGASIKKQIVTSYTMLFGFGLLKNVGVNPHQYHYFH